MSFRREESGLDLYHVVSRGTGRQLIYEGDDDRRLFLSILDDVRRRFHVELYAYCLMGNHFHLLLHAPIDRVSKFMKHLCGMYAQRFNERAGRNGHLFQSRYKSEPIEDETYLLTVVRYIHLNPVRAGICDVEKCEWSSYQEYVHEPKRCSTTFILDLLGGKDGFKSLHEDETISCECLDVDAPRSRTRPMRDEDALAIATGVLEGRPVNEVKSMERQQRNAVLRSLKRAGLSIRQLERLTGIGKGVIDRA